MYGTLVFFIYVATIAVDNACAFQIKIPLTTPTKLARTFLPKPTSSPLVAVKDYKENQGSAPIKGEESRRSVISNAAKTSMATLIAFSSSNAAIPDANAAVGTLPEYSDSNAILQGITIDVADVTQQDQMIAFLADGFKMKKVRQSQTGSVTDTWMAFGPEELRIPKDWEPAVSSFSSYGGHASVHIRYDSQTMDAYYREGNDAPGNNLAYLQFGVPEYRISQMVKNGGNVFNGYGIVEAISPSGLPVRGIIGISPDPIMLVAVNCKSVKESQEFYEQIGFIEQEYPYCRPNKGKGQFEPEQPKKSVYLAPSKNSMGVLLLQAEKKGKNLSVNPAIRSLNIVYQPSGGTMVDESSGDLKVADPSGVPIAFEPVELFDKREQSTRIIDTV